MSDNDTISRIQIELTGDQQAVQAVTRLQTQADAANKAFGAMDRASSQAAAAVSNIKLSSAASAEAKKLAQNLDEVKVKAKGAQDELDKTKKSSEFNRTQLSAAAGLASSVGGQALGAPIQIASQAAQVGESLAGVGASFGAVALAAAPVGIALGAVNLVLGDYNAMLERQRVQAEASTAALRQSLEWQGNLTTTQAAAQKQTLENQIRIDEQLINEAQKTAMEESKERAKGASGIVEFGRLLGNLANGTKPTNENLEKLKAELETNKTSLKNLTDQLTANAFAANDAVAANQRALDQRQSDAQKGLSQDIEAAKAHDLAKTTSFEAAQARLTDIQTEKRTIAEWLQRNAQDPTLAKLWDQQKARLDDLTVSQDLWVKSIIPAIIKREQEAEVIKQAAEATKRAEQAIKDFTGEAAALADLDKKRATDLAEQAKQDSRDAQVGALEDKIAKAKALEDQAAHQDKMADLRKEAAQKERDLTGGFMADSLKALKDFQLSESRQTEDYNLNRKRQMEDLYRDLTDLASQRDVAGFISRQRQGETDLTRGAEDFGIGASRRAQDFGKANEERRQQFEQQLSEQRTQAAAQIETERQAGQTRITETAKLEKQLADLRAQWAEADKQAQRNEEQQAYNERRAQLSQNLALDRAIIREHYAVEINQVKNFVQGAQAWIASLVNWTQRNNTAPEPYVRSGQRIVTANAEGGIYDKPTLGMLGERPGYSDFVFPVKRSDGIGPALDRALGGRAGTGMQITIEDKRSLTIGDIASRADIDDALARDRQAMITSLQMHISGVGG